MAEIIILILAYIIDRIIGDPEGLSHPVRWIGIGIEKGEAYFRSVIKHEKAAGALLALTVVSATYIVFYIVNMLFYGSGLPSFLLFIMFMVVLYFTYAMLATGSLVSSAMDVLKEVEKGDLVEARSKLSMIVGRDTANLEAQEIRQATIETVAENASDGIIAPLFYFAIGGLPLAMTYKAINTLDSMVGYRNEKYRDFGWAPARLDDIVNYIPARITGALIIIAAFALNIFKYIAQYSSTLLNIAQLKTTLSSFKQPLSNLEQNTDRLYLSGLNACKIMVRDGRKHLSPNSGVPEAAMAGALGIRLGGPSTYGGLIVDKPYIGDESIHAEIMDADPAMSSLSIIRIVSLLGLCTALTGVLIRNL